MPVELLISIEQQGLPATVADAGSVDKLRVLRAARLVEADIPAPGEPGAAVVHSITHEGRSLLQRIRTERDIA
ncbi:hypothetical protein SDC9_100018 [bioreactor metagenome]|uniref:HTH marR-type domain-containing protein n=1 Tax=bioreactor metagenome TaxID=1076179 RepID=A0A645AJ41_9ZZZZ